MIVAFGNTEGKIFGVKNLLVDSNNISLKLCKINILNDDYDLLIIDRYPTDVVSRVDVTEVLQVITKILQKTNPPEKLTVYLPKMSRDEYKSFNIQSQFMNLSVFKNTIVEIKFIS
ncbi:unknown [Gryllus bimaculatus nudivirus]|uniref:Uncharacterized protein n=1 Tax=Gryllus bimaculatus nudivirus TaxID=432587 RepID=A4L204_9VIRU|nr:hypothetical protein GrBNV_gp41 [Gryllus bimaculatus nudivirus]ABO45374.1 unknown [Gryllus bimaculatus nudivirus]